MNADAAQAARESLVYLRSNRAGGSIPGPSASFANDHRQHADAGEIDDCNCLGVHKVHTA